MTNGVRKLTWLVPKINDFESRLFLCLRLRQAKLAQLPHVDPKTRPEEKTSTQEIM
jgi:hypothetical protein